MTGRTCNVASAALVLAGCGLLPRTDYVEGATMAIVYQMELNQFASCVFDRLDQKYGRVQKVDFPDRKAIRLSFSSAEGMRVWEVNLASERNATRATISVPVIVGKTQPESL